MSDRSTITAVVVAGAIVVGAGGLALDGAARVHRSRTAVRYEPAAGTSRPSGLVFSAESVFAARDFDGVGSRLYVLDPLQPAVHELWFGEGGVARRNRFGRRGGGPGEFSNPTGIAVLRDPPRVAVVEPGRIHFFALDGTYQESVAPELPCAMPLPRLGAAATGLFVHGNCMRRGVSSDTMMAVLLWSRDGRTFQPVAADPRYTADGTFGNAFGTESALAEGDGRVHAFGAGSSPCVQVVVEGAGAPQARRVCDDAMQSYRLELSRATLRELEATRRRSPLLASALRVPDVHPWYAQLVVLGESVESLRGWAEDSLVLRSFGAQRDRGVFSRNGLVGCRRVGCLFAEPTTRGLRFAFFPTAMLAALP